MDKKFFFLVSLASGIPLDFVSIWDAYDAEWLNSLKLATFIKTVPDMTGKNIGDR